MTGWVFSYGLHMVGQVFAIHHGYNKEGHKDYQLAY
jgi:hypothetical protein